VLELDDTDAAAEAARDGRECPTEPLPAELGRFLVLWQAGAGGMGIVYVAYDPELDRKVAVKLLHPSVSGSDREEIARVRLVREAKAMARLSHPNVCSVYDVGTYRGQVFIAMEFIEGRSLSAWLKEQLRSRGEIIEVFAEAGRGLAAAHREGLAHGDFKPDNVLVDVKGRVRVVDFGFASAQEHGESPRPAGDRTVDLTTQITRTSALTGTPAYLSPEQFEGARGSAQTDQFSFCVSLYEGLYGERPFTGNDVDELRISLAGGVPVEPRGRQLPAWLRRILLRGLSRRPSERFADMDALLAELARDPSRRRGRLVASALIVLMLVVAALAYRWFLMRSLDERQGLCAGAAEELRGVWDEERRARAEKAFLATELPYAGDVWARVVTRLDQHTSAWVKMHTEACQATHLRGEQSAALLDLRMACLQRRLTQTRSLVDVLVEADAGVVENAAQAVAELSLLGPCADSAALLSASERPLSEEDAAAQASVREQLARARAQLLLARYPEGLELADAALQQAQTLGVPVLVAEAHFVRGELLEGVGDPLAREAIEEGFFAAEATDNEALTARLSLGLMYGSMTRFDLAAATLWSRHAGALIRRVDDGASSGRRRLEAEHSSLLGTLHTNEGKLEEAEAEYRRALELHTLEPGDRDLALAGVHNNLGNLLVRRGELVDAGMHLESAVAIYREVLGPHHPKVAVSLNNLGHLATRRQEYEAARGVYAQAYEIFVASAGADHPNVGTVDVNLGEVALCLGELDVATIHYERAWATFRQLFGEDSAPLAFPLTGLGETLLAQGDREAAVVMLERALELRDPGSASELARTRIALAKALPAGNTSRVRELATQARAGYAAAGPAYAVELEETDEWLRRWSREHRETEAPQVE